ncbi:hypothetical protein [Segeticoccus rhizosphaerae]|uniref:hypothetical protein n=1 Tax=Segeticoccus rhizosphaerae TaxID=1104777 RepID=UPI00126467C0|nr:hypothetical protein [Segeticoccus rhizosphaerae]
MSNTDEQKFALKAGGPKDAAILEVIESDHDKEMTRKDIAEAAGCTVGRVGEVVRFLAATGTKAERELVGHLVGGSRVAKVEPAKVEAPKPKAIRKPRAAKGKTTKV